MNIGLFTDTYFPQINGVGTSVHTLAKELTALGHSVYIFTPSDPNRESSDENIIPMKSMPCFIIKSFRIGLIYSPQEILKIKHLNLDIVHTQTEFSLGTFGKIISKAFGIPMVHTYHTMYEDYVHYIAHGAIISPSASHKLSRFFCNCADAVIAPTQKVYDSLRSYGVFKNMFVIPTGINTNIFLKSNFKHDDILKLKLSYGFNANTPVILILGRIAVEKNIDFIFNSAPDIFKAEPEARILVVGDGPHKNELEKLAQKLNISDKVVFAGAKPWAKIGLYYQLGDVFVSASTSETQGLTFAEAMSASIPVVAKNDKCITGLISDGKTGFLFDNKEEFIEKTTFVIKNKNNIDELIKNAFNSAQQFSSQAFAKNVEMVYKKLLDYPECFKPERANAYKLKKIPKKIHIIKDTKKGITNLAKKPANIIKNYIKHTADKKHTRWFKLVSEKMKTFMTGNSAIRAMFEEGKKMAKLYGKDKVYDFSLGNPSVEPPKEVTDAAVKILLESVPNELHGYPNNSGYEDVRAHIAQLSNKKHGTDYTEKNYVITTGAAAAINISLKVLIDPGDEVIVFAPYFSEYNNYIRNYDGVVVPVMANLETFQPNLELFEKSLTSKTKAVIINTPNNPTGVVYSEDTLKTISEILIKHTQKTGKTIYIISDEPYRELVYGGIKVPFVPDYYKNTFVAYSYSKSLSLPGERIGYVCVNTAADGFDDIVSCLNVANRISGFVNAPTLWQKVIPYCSDLKVDLSIYERNRNDLYNMLKELGYTCVEPQGAFYIFPKTLIPDDKEFCNAAKEFRLLIVPGSSFGCPGFCRISYCIPHDTIINSYESFKLLKEKFSI